MHIPSVRGLLGFVIFLVVVTVAAHGTVGDEFPVPQNTEPDGDAPVMSAGEAIEKWKLPPGFRVNVFAAEPDVQNPIDLAWDARGRLWIAENYTYAERSQRFDLSLRDRVVVFEDTDHDGTFEKRTEFTNNVQMLTSVEVGHGGVWLMCPPYVLFIPDADHDLIPDGPAQVVLDGFTVAQANYHNFANGLRFGPDGWLYGRCGGSCPGRIGKPGTPDAERFALAGGMWRYHPTTGAVEVLNSGTTNPWGHDWNEYYEPFFINTVNGHLWHGIPGAHFVRPFTLDPNPHAYEQIDQHADHWHFDTGQSWQKSRDGAANEFGGGHAHVGMMIYQGDNWPEEYRGNLFTWNIHGQRANQEIIERHGSGYIGKHGKDILLAGDPWFRGMELRAGPDGGVFAIDWSDTGECHEHTGVHRQSGRIYKITFGQTEKIGPVDFWKKTDIELAQTNSSTNEWNVRQSRLVLHERATKRALNQEAVEMLITAATTSESPQHRVRALYTLHAVGASNQDLFDTLLKDDHESVRAAVVRLMVDEWAIDDTAGPVRTVEINDDVRATAAQLTKFAAEERSGLVLLSLSSNLQRLPLELRPELASAIVKRDMFADDHNLPLLVWYGLTPVASKHPELLVPVLADCWPKTIELITRRIVQHLDSSPDAMDNLLAWAARSNNQEARMAIATGMEKGLRGWRKAPVPKTWPAFVKSLDEDDTTTLSASIRSLNVLFGDGRALEEVRAIALQKDADINARISALETLIESRPDDLEEVCVNLLSDARMNVTAARGIAVVGSENAGEQLAKSYGRFRSPNRPKVIAILCSRPSFARALLDAVEKGRIPKHLVSAYDIRQLQTLNDAELKKRIQSIWGEVRESSAEKRVLIETMKGHLSSPGKIDLAAGRRLFEKSCAKCHKLYGAGETIGPDLTGSNRNNLDYLLENIFDPSAVVSKDYRMTIVELKDGRVLNGLVLLKNEKTLTIQTPTEKTVLLIDDIERMKLTDQSPMPDGLLKPLSLRELRHLFGYLQHPTQVELPDVK